MLNEVSISSYLFANEELMRGAFMNGLKEEIRAKESWLQGI